MLSIFKQVDPAVLKARLFPCHSQSYTAKKAPNDVAHASWSQGFLSLAVESKLCMNYCSLLQIYIQKCRERDGRVLGKE